MTEEQLEALRPGDRIVSVHGPAATVEELRAEKGAVVISFENDDPPVPVSVDGLLEVWEVSEGGS